MRRFTLLALSVAGAALLAGCSDPAAPEAALAPDAPVMDISGAACWGQATQVFARMGEMGAHASEQANPRLGLANLARALYDAGALDEPTLQALGAFVADALGLTIDACMT